MEYLGFDEDDNQQERLSKEFFTFLDPICRAAVMENALYWWQKEGYKTVITSVLRTRTENEAVNGYQYSGHLVRKAQDSFIVYAVDKRTRDMETSFRQQYQSRFALIWNGLLYIQFEGNHLHCGVPRIHQVGEIV